MAIYDDILKLKDEGLTHKEIAEQLSITTHKITALLKQQKSPTEPKADMPELEAFSNEEKSRASGVIIPEVVGIQILSPEEYMEQNIRAGRAPHGGVLGEAQLVTVEELRAYINSGWTPSMCMGKWQIDEEALKQLIWRLSQAEMRDRPITINYKMDFFK